MKKKKQNDKVVDAVRKADKNLSKNNITSWRLSMAIDSDTGANKMDHNVRIFVYMA